MTKPRVLCLDIETRPAKVYAWRAYDESFSPEQVIDGGGIICVGAKWLGEKGIIFLADWIQGHDEMLKQLHALLEEADAVVHFNGVKFDMPKIEGEFALANLPPPPTPTNIDVLKTIKKFGFFMNRLAFIGPLFKVGSKIKHEGFPLWTAVMAGDPKAQRRMERYCLQDVRLLERLYVRIRPYIRNHPHMGNTKSGACGGCGSHKMHSRGYRRTRAFRIQRLQCQDCGAWQDGKREKMS